MKSRSDDLLDTDIEYFDIEMRHLNIAWRQDRELYTKLKCIINVITT